MSLHRQLSQRAAQGRPIRVGLIGAGKFGSMYLAQIPRTPGVHLVGIADLSPEAACRNLARVGWPAERIQAASLEAALKDGNTHVGAAWLPRLTSMELIASYCLTEPGSGSDAASLKTKAVRDGDHYVITGTKQFISGAGTSDVYVLMARTSDDGAKGVSAFILEKGMKGLSFGANERKMGWKSQPTAQVILDEVRVPAANRIGEEGHGFKFAMAGLDGGRLNIAACALGGAQLALDKAVAYAQDRKQFGKAIADFQSVQFKLADMETELQAARVMLYEAAGRLDGKTPDATRWCAMAKRFVTDTAFKVANDALQIHGGYGYLADYHVERIVRDLRVHQILEGTNEIMRVIISRDMLKG